MKRLLVFDFDHSLIDEDSDRFIFKQLSPVLLEELYALSGQVQFTDLIDQLLSKLHAQGITRDVILDTFKHIKMHPRMLELLAFVQDEHLCDIAILSDSNTVYIETILHHFQIRHRFKHIITNPAAFDDQGRLSVRRYCPADTPHGCPNGCALNICKGKELIELLQGEYHAIYYIGDGRNDYCPCSKLSGPWDVAFVRKGFGLERFLDSGKGSLSVEVKKWTDAPELYDYFKELLK